MKKYFAIFALVLASAFSAYGFNKLDKDPDSVVIELIKETVNTGSDRERTLDFVIIEACAYPSQEMVEVTLYNIGDASVRLINSNGQVVSADYLQTDALTVVYLNTYSTSGTFYLEIVSDSWYAEGVATF